jgi:hypothetical protein
MTPSWLPPPSMARITSKRPAITRTASNLRWFLPNRNRNTLLRWQNIQSVSNHSDDCPVFCLGYCEPKSCHWSLRT